MKCTRELIAQNYQLGCMEFRSNCWKMKYFWRFPRLMWGGKRGNEWFRAVQSSAVLCCGERLMDPQQH